MVFGTLDAPMPGTFLLQIYPEDLSFPGAYSKAEKADMGMYEEFNYLPGSILGSRKSR